MPQSNNSSAPNPIQKSSTSSPKGEIAAEPDSEAEFEPGTPPLNFQSGNAIQRKVTSNNILDLQRTIGNQAVMRLMANNPSSAARPVSPTTIQRKIAFPPNLDKTINNIAATAGNVIFSSTFKDIRDYKTAYLKAKNEAEEVKYLKKMQTAAQDWKKKNSSSEGKREQDKHTSMSQLDVLVSKELARIEGAFNLVEVGLPDSFIKELSDNEYSNLIMAVSMAKQGKMEIADVYLDNMRKTRGSAVNLIRSNIVRTHIGKIDAGLAKTMNKSDFKVNDKTAGQSAKFIQGEADQMIKSFNEDEEAFKGKYGEKMANETGQLSTHSSTMKNIGYKDAAPLANLGYAGQVLQAGQALQTGKPPTEEAKASMKSLTPHEMTTLVGYTSNLYGSFSNPLRQNAGRRAFKKENLALTETAVSAMNKFKNYVGTVYRHDSIYPGFRELNRPGGVTTDLGFMSTAKEQQAASNGGTHHEVLIILSSKTGKEIGVASIFGGEGEVLFKPGTRFKVIKTASKDKVQGWQNVDPQIQKYLDADGKKDMLEMVVIKEEI
ncbi:MAG: hypothetical protein J0I20_01595 [Chloroflexi bacterium]|nr:hypothetical protein [Chloroflexota bacterium]OJV89523.1 MAG: hypothetical protein BGO39_36790 [Chloroflexi bacterium 54-19]